MPLNYEEGNDEVVYAECGFLNQRAYRCVLTQSAVSNDGVHRFLLLGIGERLRSAERDRLLVRR